MRFLRVVKIKSHRIRILSSVSVTFLVMCTYFDAYRDWVVFYILYTFRQVHIFSFLWHIFIIICHLWSPPFCSKFFDPFFDQKRRTSAFWHAKPSKMIKNIVLYIPCIYLYALKIQNHWSHDHIAHLYYHHLYIHTFTSIFKFYINTVYAEMLFIFLNRT